MRAQFEVAALEAAESLANVTFGDECASSGDGTAIWTVWVRTFSRCRLGRVEGGASLGGLFRAGLNWLRAVRLIAMRIGLDGLRRG